MAVIKIQRSTAKVNVPRSGNITAAQLNQNVGIQFGNAIASLGDAVTLAAKKQKTTNDKNKLQDLITETLPLLQGKQAAYNKSTDINDTNKYLASMDIKEFESILTNENKEVKDLFNTYLFKQTLSGYREVYTGITARHIKETKFKQENSWNELTNDMASNDPGKATTALEDFNATFIDPDVIDKYTPEELKKIKEEKLLQATQLRFWYRTRNNPIDVLAQGKEITKKYGVKEATRILDDAKNVLVSQTA